MNRTLLMFLKFAQFALLAVIVLDIYAVLRMAHVQYDATEEKLIQLSPETVGIIRGLEADKPVRIRAYFSNDVPRNMVETRDNLETFLDGIERLSGGRMIVKVTRLDAGTPEAYEIERVYNIRPRTIIEPGDNSPRPMEVIMGLVFSSGLKERTIPFFERGLSEELELARNIKLVNGDTLTRIGVLGTDAHVFGNYDFMTNREIPGWRFIQELQKQYEIKRLTPDNLRRYYFDGGSELKPDDKIKMLIVPMASTLTERELYYLHQYIWTGAPVLILDDPFPTVNYQLAPKLEKRIPNYPGQPPNMGDAPPKGNIENFFRSMGLNWNSEQSVWASYNPYPILPFSTQHVFFLGRHVPVHTAGAGDDDNAVVLPSGYINCFGEKDEVSAHLQELLMFLPGGFTKAGDAPAGIEVTPLLQSPIPSGTHRVQEIVPNAFRKPFEPELPEPTLTFYSASTDPIMLAARITGRMRNAYPGGMPPAPGNSAAGDTEAARYADPAKQPAAGPDQLSAQPIHVIFIPDIDMISDQFFSLRDEMPDFGGVTIDLDNTRFVLNCVDELAGDNVFLALRNRRPVHRPMDRMDAFRDVMVRKMAKEINRQREEADKEIADLKKQLKETETAIQSRKDLDQTSKNIAMNRDYKQLEKNTNEKIEKINQNLTRTKTDLERNTRTELQQLRAFVLIWPIIIPVSLILAIGLGVFLVRFLRERTEIPTVRKRN